MLDPTRIRGAGRWGELGDPAGETRSLRGFQVGSLGVIASGSLADQLDDRLGSIAQQTLHNPPPGALELLFAVTAGRERKTSTCVAPSRSAAR